MKNIAFIGMPGCGKTRISLMVARKLKCAWHDCDSIIEQREYRTIAEIFAQSGEEYFRNCETELIRELLSGSGAVISTGGGAVLRNADILRDRAVVVYLHRDIELIAQAIEASSDDTRPLLNGGTERLYELYKQRRELYESTMHICVDNNSGVDEAVDRVVEALAEWV